MALIDDVKNILNELAPHGWKELFEEHGLDIISETLQQDLIKKPLAVNRNLDGFKDFSKDGKFAITPGIPSQSLLYHALASPAVLTAPNGNKLSKFPTIKQIETIENYVYASTNRNLKDVISLFTPNSEFSIAVFALEYRNLPETVHKRHADLCFSRTGVARVGNSEQMYIPEKRGFLSHIEGDSNEVFRVIPVRYAAYISVLQKGDENRFGPARFDLGTLTNQSDQSDSDIDFWVPVHKLFSGLECLSGEDLELEINYHHVNEKLKRVHIEKMGVSGFNTGHSGKELESWPFKFSNSLGELSDFSDDGSFLLKPIKHPLVEEVIDQNKRIGTIVPPQSSNFFSPSFTINGVDIDGDGNPDSRKAPEYVHVRDKIVGANIQKLNNQRSVIKRVNSGNYKAQHYLDFAADGWIEVECKEISSRIVNSIPAYSIIAAPDFFPHVNQGELMDWWIRLPRNLQQDIWSVPPLSLSDQRTAANLELKIEGPGISLEVFNDKDISITAVVSQHRGVGTFTLSTAKNEVTKIKRQGVLPDAAAGVFAPGWDTSMDDKKGTLFLSAYGLGSPFPEDAKLCAAISTFWPAAAPDSSRQFAPSVLSQRTEKAYATVCPLTDKEIGLDDQPSWDGNIGPQTVQRGSREVIEYMRFEYVDYIENSLLGKMSLAITAKIDIDDYTNRILGMNRVYQALGIQDSPNSFNEKRRWGIQSFTKVDSSDNDVQSALSAGINITGRILKFIMFESKGRINHPSNFKKVHVEIKRKVVLLYNGLRRVHLFENNQWTTNQVR
ncbi:hypothetical protein [Spongiimicrobium sp. 2-473A-2-J]|uniref:hypothetical protein n=1 Tax=Eudoraea algarum TaxID=3417568 RepID=UPI003D36FD8E